MAPTGGVVQASRWACDPDLGSSALERGCSVITIAHPVCDTVKSVEDTVDQFRREPLVLHRTPHAGQPLVALQSADGKRQMPRAQARVAVLFYVIVRAAEIATEKQKKFVARRIQTGAMRGPQRLEIGFDIHQVVK